MCVRAGECRCPWKNHTPGAGVTDVRSHLMWVLGNEPALLAAVLPSRPPSRSRVFSLYIICPCDGQRSPKDRGCPLSVLNVTSRISDI